MAQKRFIDNLLSLGGLLAGGIAVCVFALLLTIGSTHFTAEADFADGRILVLAAFLVLSGAVFALALPAVISTAVDQKSTPADAFNMLLWIALAGLAARLILFASTPILEDDFYRYLWDGGVTAHGLNPFAVPPGDIASLPPSNPLSTLGARSDDIHERINHPHLKTIYPPVAQAAFALAHIIGPWNITGWRIVCLVGDCATLALLIALLKTAGRSPLWVALYWWNPLVLKELFNSAHMEAVLMPLVLSAIVFSIRGRIVSSASMLALAAGVKLWPLLLLPVLLRTSRASYGRMIAALMVTGLIAVVLALPILVGGLDQTSGFVAYASKWQTNSALFPSLLAGAEAFLNLMHITSLQSAAVARGLIAFALGGLACIIAWRPVETADDALWRSTLVCLALVLVSPAQFPWYMVWMMPFVVFSPWRGILALSVFVPIYYASFHFHQIDRYPDYATIVVWIVWLPVWLLLIIDGQRAARRSSGQKS